MQEIEEYANGLERELDKELVEEEKRERMRIKKDIEEIKWLKLVEYEEKLKKGEKKANFGQLLDEYSQKRKEVESEILAEQRIMEEELKKKLDDKKKRRLLDINEERRMKELELEKSSGG